jgi:hypothetical protein
MRLLQILGVEEMRMLYGHPSKCWVAVHLFTFYVYESSNAHGPAMRIPKACGVHQGCGLGAMFLAIAASRVFKKLAAIAPNESVVCVYSDDMISFWDPMRLSWLLATLCQRRMLASAS